MRSCNACPAPGTWAGGALQCSTAGAALPLRCRERCVAAGDSGNDTLMLGGRNKAVVVGNAQPELVQWFLQQPQTERLVMSDAPLARGLLEGLARHGLF